jgi:hypothetical protein
MSVCASVPHPQKWAPELTPIRSCLRVSASLPPARLPDACVNLASFRGRSEAPRNLVSRPPLRFQHIGSARGWVFSPSLLQVFARRVLGRHAVFDGSAFAATSQGHCSTTRGPDIIARNRVGHGDDQAQARDEDRRCNHRATLRAWVFEGRPTGLPHAFPSATTKDITASVPTPRQARQVRARAERTLLGPSTPWCRPGLPPHLSKSEQVEQNKHPTY